jgi:hypothetical protein
MIQLKNKIDFIVITQPHLEDSECARWYILVFWVNYEIKLFWCLGSFSSNPYRSIHFDYIRTLAVIGVWYRCRHSVTLLWLTCKYLWLASRKSKLAPKVEVRSTIMGPFIWIGYFFSKSLEQVFNDCGYIAFLSLFRYQTNTNLSMMLKYKFSKAKTR